MLKRCRGFTLLELLVVLVILALAATIATPAVMKLTDSVGRKNKRDLIVMYLQELPVSAMRSGTQSLLETSGYQPVDEVLGSDAERRLGPDLNGSRVWVPQRIDYRSNGACNGGVTHWELPDGQRITLELSAPLCRPRVVS